MRIALIAPPWVSVPPSGYGGTEAVIDTLARGLDRAGHDVLLIAHPDSTCPVPSTSVVPVGDEVPMGRAKIELEHAIGGYGLASGYDVISDHTLSGPLVATGRPGIPVVATNHNPFDRSRSAILAAAGDRVDVVAISHAHARSSPVGVTRVIHHGIDVDEFPVGNGDGGYLVALTRMDATKGVDRAATLARRAGVRLLIAAKLREPHEREYFDRAIAPLLGDGVEFIGEVDGVAKRELLAGAVAMLNPIAWDEPFGMTMLESMACGTPVIVTNRGSAPELVKHGESGLLGDTDAELLAAIEQVGELDRSACRRHVEQRFSAPAMCANYVAAYQAAIDRIGLWVG